MTTESVTQQQVLDELQTLEPGSHARGCMELLDTIPIDYQGTERLIQLFHGDLAHLPPEETVEDAREGDRAKIERSAAALLGQI